jgi:hypothetical protein
MRCWFLIISLLVSVSAISAENRCGWLVHPTPGNLWLVDADSNWTISIQGVGFPNEESMDKMPEIDEKEFVRTNGYYGFSCVCLNVKTDRKKSKILNVYSGKQLLLKECLEDSNIAKKIPIR